MFCVSHDHLVPSVIYTQLLCVTFAVCWTLVNMLFGVPWVVICKVPSLVGFGLPGESGGPGFGFLSGCFAGEGDGTGSGFLGYGDGLGHLGLCGFGTGLTSICLESLKCKFPGNASLIALSLSYLGDTSNSLSSKCTI